MLAGGALLTISSRQHLATSCNSHILVYQWVGVTPVDKQWTK